MRTLGLAIALLLAGAAGTRAEAPAQSQTPRIVTATLLQAQPDQPMTAIPAGHVRYLLGCVNSSDVCQHKAHHKGLGWFTVIHDHHTCPHYHAPYACYAK